MRLAAILATTAAMPIGLLLLAYLATSYATEGSGMHPGLAVWLAAVMSGSYVAGCFLLMAHR